MAIDFRQRQYNPTQGAGYKTLLKGMETAISRIPTRDEKLVQFDNEFFQNQFASMTGEFDLDGNYSSMIDNPNFVPGGKNFEYEPKFMPDGSENPSYKGPMTKKIDPETGQPVRIDPFSSKEGFMYVTKDQALNNYLKQMRTKHGDKFTRKMGSPLTFSAKYDQFELAQTERLKQQILKLKSSSPKKWTNKALYDAITNNKGMMEFMKRTGMFGDPELKAILGPHTYFGDTETSVFGKPFTAKGIMEGLGETLLPSGDPQKWMGDAAKVAVPGALTIWATKKGWQKISGGWRTPAGTTVSSQQAKTLMEADNFRQAKTTVTVKGKGGKMVPKEVQVYVDKNGNPLKHTNGQPIRVVEGVEPPKNAVKTRAASWKDFKESVKTKGPGIAKNIVKGSAAYYGGGLVAGELSEQIAKATNANNPAEWNKVGNQAAKLGMDVYFTNSMIKAATGQNVGKITMSGLNSAKNSVPKMVSMFGQIYKDKGIKWITKTALKKLGPLALAKTIGKMGAAAFTAPTVVLSAAMAAWTAYDAYNLMQALVNAYVDESKGVKSKITAGKNPVEVSELPNLNPASPMNETVASNYNENWMNPLFRKK